MSDLKKMKANNWQEEKPTVARKKNVMKVCFLCINNLYDNTESLCDVNIDYI